MTEQKALSTLSNLTKTCVPAQQDACY